MDSQTQAEFDRYFSSDPGSINRTHPEDRESHPANEVPKDSHGDEEGHGNEPEDEDSDFADEVPVVAAPAARTGGRGYTIPTRREYANTGVKGVIADAQAYEAARRQQRYGSKSSATATAAATPTTSLDQRHGSRRSSQSETEMDESALDDEDDFTRQWRLQRMQELQNRATDVRGQQQQLHRQQHYGMFTKLNADGYLDVVEKSPVETFVVVLLWDYSEASEEWEDELKQLAYRHGRVRFIGLRWDVAEIQHMAVPSIVVYRGGDVFATIDEPRSEDIRTKLKQIGVLLAT